MTYLEKYPNDFLFGIEIVLCPKNLEGGWSGFGMVTVGIHPNNFGVWNGHPNKIPTNELLGDVVNNCRKLCNNIKNCA